jgi:hypothetical protein
MDCYLLYMVVKKRANNERIISLSRQYLLCSCLRKSELWCKKSSLLGKIDKSDQKKERFCCVLCEEEKRERRGDIVKCKRPDQQKKEKKRKGDLGQSLKATYYGVLSVGDLHSNFYLH